ncbi:hypothetical protein [Modestobacter sp. SYSU DS0657]
MSWTLHLQPIRNPWADAALLVGGRALYVAQAFEDKCRSLLRFGHLVDALQADPVAKLEELIGSVPRDRLLKPTLVELARLFPEVGEHEAVLTRAREARNYIAHEGLRFSIHDERAAGLKARLPELHQHVEHLATGDNLVSALSFRLHEPDQLFPDWLVETYESMIESWVFEPLQDFIGGGEPAD